MLDRRALEERFRREQDGHRDCPACLYYPESDLCETCVGQHWTSCGPKLERMGLEKARKP